MTGTSGLVSPGHVIGMDIVDILAATALGLSAGVHIMTVHRDYTGETPCGMKFTTLAGVIGGGQVTPGFVGHSKYNVCQRKFVVGDGGLARVVWMPKSLKEELRERLIKRGEELDMPDLLDRIADETVGLTEDEILPFLTEKNHPALGMDPIIG